MAFKNSEITYGSVAKFLHALIFILVIAMLTVGFLMGGIQDKPLKGQIINLHKLIGISILILMILRAIWAFTNSKPALPAGTPSWQKFAERVVHFLIYAVLIAMPIAGWVMSVAAGYLPHLFGFNLSLPAVPKSEALSDRAFDIHSYLAYALIALISIHALAALYHYFIKKDNVLQRMIYP